MSEISLSMLPTPTSPPSDNVAARLRHRLRADFEAKRQLQRENLQLRQELARLQRRLRQRVQD